MFTIKKIFRVPTGHRLTQHKGLCKNIHGHNLKVEVVISSNKLDDNGMVMDFKDLSVMMKPMLDKYDHALLLNSEDKEFVKFVKDNNYKHVIFHSDPTAEHIAMSFYYFIKAQLQYAEQDVESVTVWENDDSAATFDNIIR